jgi:hypothetical protein
MKKTELWVFEEYWRRRGDRAVAASLLHTHGLLTAAQQRLTLVRQTLHTEAILLRESNSGQGLERHHVRVANYYRADGRLLRLAKRLGQRIGRYSANRTKLA